MNPIAVISILKETGIFFSARHRTSFVCSRRKKNGDRQNVLVEILDAGQDAGEDRYYCIATSEDKTVTGNPAASIEVVIRDLNWEAVINN